MLMAAQLALELVSRVLHPIRKISLEPVASLGTYAQVTAGFTVNPRAKIDPIIDFLRPLAVPRHILA
ncbi:hypothetical protein D3C78_1383500 [compost metagenome]